MKDCPECGGILYETRVGPGIGEPALKCDDCDYEELLA